MTNNLIFKAGTMSIEQMHERTVRLMADLVKYLLAEGELLRDHIDIGFDRLFDRLVLDVN